MNLDLLSSKEIEALLQLHWNGVVSSTAVKALEKLKGSE